MKTELPKKSKEHQDTIHEMCDIIIENFSDRIAFIILFGSFARGDWVYDYYTEDNRDYEFASDYDFLIITKKAKHGTGYQATRLENNIGKKLIQFKRLNKPHKPTIIVEPIDRVNNELEKGRYFFSDIKKEGICLYNSEEFELVEAKKLTNLEIKEIAKLDFEQWFNSADGFLRDSKSTFALRDYKKSAFYLHQATESFFNCTLLVLAGYKPKLHDIESLNSWCASQSNEFLKIFPKATQEQEESFKLLKNAYIDARYSKDYNITNEQLKFLIEQVTKLKQITEKICTHKLNSLN